MNKRYFLTLAAIGWVCAWALAQVHEPYQWEQNRQPNWADSIAGEALTAKLIAYKYQYGYDVVTRDFICYKTTHKILRVNNDQALASSNRIYIPMRSTLELIAVKARAFAKDGRVVYLDEKNIKELKDEEAGYRIFAIEGAEVGGEIEYYFTQKIAGNAFGREVLQFDYPVDQFQFRLSAPEHLEFEFLVVNDTANVAQTDTTDQGNFYALDMRGIPALHEEAFSAHDASRRRIDFKLAYNSEAQGKVRLYTWGMAGMRVHEQLFVRSKEEDKALKALMKTLKIAPTNAWDGLLKAEHHLKTGYGLEQNGGPGTDEIDFILKNRYGSSRGYTRLYIGLAALLGLKYEVVVTSNRFEKRFEPTFDTWDYLDDFLIYFPEKQAFLSPDSPPFRVGTIPVTAIGNYGLFIREEPVQTFTHPVTRVAQIPEPSYTSNFDNLDITVTFPDDLSAAQVKVVRSYAGYSAQYYKMAMMVLEEERKQQMLDEIVKYLALDATIESMEVTRSNTTYQGWHEPFEVTSTFTSAGYVKRAGPTLLLNAGMLIGPQSELYQEYKRETDVVNENNRGYLRKIRVKLPEGYTVQNPDDLVLKDQVFEGQKLIYNFDSRYEIKDGELLITIDEWYDQLHYPKEKFEAFRKVINAAADWNKVVLVLKKG